MNLQSSKTISLNIKELDSLINLSGYHIYFLFSGPEIIYIGQSNQIHKRIYSHSLNKNFDSFIIKKINNKNLDLEAYLIFKFKPKLNYSLPSNKRFLNIKKFDLVGNLYNSKSFEINIIGHVMYVDSSKFNFLKSLPYEKR